MKYYIEVAYLRHPTTKTQELVRDMAIGFDNALIQFEGTDSVFMIDLQRRLDEINSKYPKENNLKMYKWRGFDYDPAKTKGIKGRLDVKENETYISLGKKIVLRFKPVKREMIFF